MKDINEAKLDYAHTPVPEELPGRVERGIAQGKRTAARRRTARRSFGSAAACFAAVVLCLNVFPSFASAAADVPVVGGLFHVLTVRSYTQRDADRTVTVEQPAVSGGGDFAQRINAEIQARVDEKIAAGNRVVEEYKEAFLETGGTEEQWEARDNSVSVTYEIKAQTDTTVSFVVDTFVNTASAYQEEFFYNLDVAGDRELTLRDLLGENWVAVCNESIRTQMAESDDPSVFFGADLGGFETVDDTTGFYINAAGNPVVVFPRASVAIGAMGAVEFEIGG